MAERGEETRETGMNIGRKLTQAYSCYHQLYSRALYAGSRSVVSSQLLDATGGTYGGWELRHHQSEALEQEYSSLCGSAPYELAALALAVLYVGVAP